MPSSFTWLDYSERERRQAQHVISLFREQDTRDELGLATIRDTVAEMLFPGTSTIQTRARYFLFVPWLYRGFEASRMASSKIGARMRAAELTMIETLLASGEISGVIGSTSRKNLQRTPSNIYWFGLGSWGIRLFNGSQEQYHSALDSYYTRNRGVQRADDGEPIDGVAGSNWHAGLPPAPAGFPNNMTLALSRGEAEYLRERIMLSHQDTLLRFLVDRGKPIDRVLFAWMHPQYAEFPANVKVQLEHARCFSETMHGAALLYNLMLAELGNLDDYAEGYRNALAIWSEMMTTRRAEHDRWSTEEFWSLMASHNARIPITTRVFAVSWLTLVREVGPAGIATSDRAQKLVKDREVALKHSRARLVNPRSLELWNGSAGSGQLNYRWRGTEIIVNDILNGLEAGNLDA